MKSDVARLVRLVMLSSLGLSVVAAAHAGASSAPRTTIETASLSGVTATYSYAGTFPQSLDSRLKIARAGVVVFDQPVTSKWCGNECWPDAIAKATRVVHVVRLRAQGSPDVVLDLYSGGAHCCSVEQVYYFDATTSRYVKVERNFGDPGARLERLGAGASDDFVTANDAFAYEFTDFAASGCPSRSCGSRITRLRTSRVRSPHWSLRTRPGGSRRFVKRPAVTTTTRWASWPRGRRTRTCLVA